MEPYIGQIILVGFNFAPRGFAFCHGQLLSIAQYQALFSLLGTTYGGDGRSTFALPDLRGRAPIGFGAGPGLTPRTLGQRSGLESNVLNVNNLPAHNHTVSLAVAEEGNTDDPNGHYIAGNGTQSFTTAPDSNKNLGPSNSGNTGGSSAVNNMQPYLAMNYCIALQGIFPPRS